MGQEKYPVTDHWKARVRDELNERGRGAAATLARSIGCSTGQLSELLSASSQYSPLVPAIHEFFGWEHVRPPIPIAISPETNTIRYLVDHATPEQRRYMLDAATMLARAPQADATQALMSMLRAFRTGFDPKRDVAALLRMLVVVDGADVGAIEATMGPWSGRVQLLMTDNAIDAGLLIGAQRPSIVVVDEALDGLDLCRRVRASYGSHEIGVIIASDRPTKAFETQARGAGALRVIPKPIDVIAILASIGAS